MTGVDADLSRRVAEEAKATHGACYWNAARALLQMPELRRMGAAYVEGVVCYAVCPHRKAWAPSLGVNGAVQGWLELPGGVVVDPTAVLDAEAARKRARQDPDVTLARMLHVPIFRAPHAEFVGDRWGELPVTFLGSETAQQTMHALDVTLDAVTRQLVVASRVMGGALGRF